MDSICRSDMAVGENVQCKWTRRTTPLHSRSDDRISVSRNTSSLTTTMPSKSPAQILLEKADKKANSSGGWFTSSSTKYEEAGDLYQQAANSFKLEKLFKEAGDA